MRSFQYSVITAMFLALASVWAGEHHSGEDQVAQEKPYIFTSQSMTTTALVEAIDHETRVVTLRGPQGNSITFTATEEVRNLDQVETGDIVNAEYVQNLSIEVYENPGVTPTENELSTADRTEKGEMPGMTTFGAHAVSATVEEINLQTDTFKLKWPDGSVEEFAARDPENLKRAKVGDLVVITRTEKLAISVEGTKGE